MLQMAIFQAKSKVLAKYFPFSGVKNGLVGIFSHFYQIFGYKLQILAN